MVVYNRAQSPICSVEYVMKRITISRWHRDKDNHHIQVAHREHYIQVAER